MRDRRQIFFTAVALSAMAFARLANAFEEPITDVHVHLVALPDGKNGCILADKMLHSLIFRLEAWHLGLPIDYPERTNRLYIERLVSTLQSSQDVKQAVLLGLDGVYGPAGELDRDK